MTQEKKINDPQGDKIIADILDNGFVSKNTEKTENPQLTGKRQGEVGYKKPPKEYRFKPGHSGNPKGAKEGTISIIVEIKKQLAKVPQGEQKTNLKLIVAEMMKKGRAGDEKIMRLVLNYVEGMPKQAMDLTSGGEPMGVIFLPRRKRDELPEANIIKQDATVESPTKADNSS